MGFARSAGVLLHPASLPGKYGIGDLGGTVTRWLDFLRQSKQSVWQVLPLGPTGFGNSPYSSPSAFAGNPCLVDPEDLVERGLLSADALDNTPTFDDGWIRYDQVIPFKKTLLERSFRHFERRSGDSELRSSFDRFCESQAYWLEDYALFEACKEENEQQPWNRWQQELRMREPGALADARQRLAEQIRHYKYCQWLFYEQWLAVLAAAHQRDISIIGDIPIFVAADSADVWANQHLFHLDENGSPTVVAGVPPDYFSATGQRWGNPLYRWDAMADDGYDWWIRRVRSNLDFFDFIRIDHFRGFEAYWEIPASQPDAVKGRWVKGPGQALFDALRAALTELPIYAEDLGIITPEVERLRDDNNLAGIKVLQFAFAGNALDPHLPHNYNSHCVVFTGTHDNDTTNGWYAKAPEHERHYVRRYLAVNGEDMAWDMVRCAYASVADMVIVPMQDILGLGSEARMNAPGTSEGCWSWRLTARQLDERLAHRLGDLTELYGRVPNQRPVDTPYRQTTALDSDDHHS